MRYKKTRSPNHINKIDDRGVSTTYKKGTEGYNEYLAWLREGNEAEPFQTDQEKIDFARDRAYKRILSGFDNQLSIGCPVSVASGIQIDSELIDARNFSLAYTAANLKAKAQITICDFNNNVHTLSIADFETLLKELDDYVQGAFNKKWALREQIKNATTESELDQIKW